MALIFFILLSSVTRGDMKRKKITTKIVSVTQFDNSPIAKTRIKSENPKITEATVDRFKILLVTTPY
jgi:hypothetical protein